ncbi:hypothetical protein DH2020_031412 [Rehmannia glutinosa]|uniref:Uncharacterized protein n=1 Tax=Rehmannia glutinosa TaxID=99300 RepID=A0ABR0VJP0_REHGL
MDLEAPPRERLDLTMSVKNDPTFSESENVRVMAQSNLVTHKEGYFHTVICNQEFRQTAINHDLHYIAWDYPQSSTRDH